MFWVPPNAWVSLRGLENWIWDKNMNILHSSYSFCLTEVQQLPPQWTPRTKQSAFRIAQDICVCIIFHPQLCGVHISNTHAPNAHFPFHIKASTTAKASPTCVAIVLFAELNQDVVWIIETHQAYFRDISSTAFFCITRACMSKGASDNCWAFRQIWNTEMHPIKLDIVTWKSMSIHVRTKIYLPAAFLHTRFYSRNCNSIVWTVKSWMLRARNAIFSIGTIKSNVTDAIFDVSFIDF